MRHGVLTVALTCLALAASTCATAKSAEVRQLEDTLAMLKNEVRDLQSRLDGERSGPAAARVSAQLAAPTGIRMPGGDAATLTVGWNAVHAGIRINALVTPQGGGESAPATVLVQRGAQ